MTDPIQALIDAGAIPSSPFAPDSRYYGTAFGLYQRSTGDRGAAYVLRRFIPQARDIPAVQEHIVHAELYWRIADANAVTDPFELTNTLGARIAISRPPGV